MKIIDSTIAIVHIRALCSAEEIFNDYLFAREFDNKSCKFIKSNDDGSIEGVFNNEKDTIPFPELLQTLKEGSIRSDYAYARIEYKGDGMYLIARNIPFDEVKDYMPPPCTPQENML